MKRRRMLVLGAAVLALDTTGCRLFNRNDDCCDTRALLPPRDCDPCRQGFAAAPPVGSPYAVPGPTTNFSSVAAPVLGAPAYPSSWSIGPSFPVYPTGQPVIIPSAGSPANELPYPTITPPGVPESPSSQKSAPTALTGSGAKK